MSAVLELAKALIEEGRVAEERAGDHPEPEWRDGQHAQARECYRVASRIREAAAKDAARIALLEAVATATITLRRDTQPLTGAWRALDRAGVLDALDDLEADS